MSLSKIQASKSLNTFNLNNDNEENKKIFTNLFNDLCINKNNILESSNLNTNKVSKNILRIINPIIKGLLKDSNKHITKDEFLFYMNNLFYNISSIDKRLLIYTYNNKSNKNNSFILSNNNYNNLKKSAFAMRPATPNFSTRANLYKNEIINKNNIYEYNYYNSDKNREMNFLNNNGGFRNSKTQKNIDEFLYGNNSHYYYGF